MRQVRKRLLTALLEILDGEATAPTRRQLRRSQVDHPLHRFHADEDGKISFVSVFVVLAILVMIGVVINAGSAVSEKIELQNAADAGSYSTTLWMARGMNAVATTNHLMGEATGLIVILESLGGEELDGNKESTNENSKLNRQISGADPNDAAALGSVALYIRQYELKFIKQVQELLAKGDNGKIDAGATIYDAQLNLKYWAARAFTMKRVANLVYLAITAGSFGFGEPLASGITTAVHLVMDAGLVWICKDWMLMKGVEIIATVMKPVKEAIPYLITALSLYGDSVAKRGRLSEPISDTLSNLAGANDVDELRVFPDPERLILPVTPERPPEVDEGTAQTVPPSLWNENDEERYWLVKLLRTPERKLQDLIDQVNRFIRNLTGGGFGFWDPPQIPSVQDFMKRTGLFPVGAELLDNATASAALKPGGVGFPENPSLKELPKLDWQQERHSQWVRATTPYVYSFRSSLNKLFADYMGMSNAWTYYTNWTNRYTIAVAHDLRSESVINVDTSNDNPLKDIQKKIEEFRERFEEAMRGPETEEKYDTAPVADDPIKSIADEFLAFVESLATPSGMPPAMQQIVRKWIQQVTDTFRQSGTIDQDRENAPFDETDDLEESDYRGMIEDTSRIQWLDQLLQLLEELLDLEVAPPHMYVMVEMKPKEKGREPWTGDRARAERLFTVVATAQRETRRASIFDTVLPDPSNGRRTYSQAMVYNANGRFVGDDPTPTDNQPKTGWDTLNWDFNKSNESKTPEWGGQKPEFAGSPVSMFRGDLPATAGAKVKLNWQAKLVPLTDSRLSDAAAEFETTVISDQAKH